jgi:hypothetical protein
MKRISIVNMTLFQSPVQLTFCSNGTRQGSTTRLFQARNQHEAGSNQSIGSAYSSTIKVEMKYSCGRSAGFQQNTQRYIAEDTTLHSQRCKSLKSRNRNPYHSLPSDGTEAWRREKSSFGSSKTCRKFTSALSGNILSKIPFKVKGMNTEGGDYMPPGIIFVGWKASMTNRASEQ